MKKGLKLNKSILAICFLVIYVSCSSQYIKEDVTEDILDSFTTFASESDTVAIQEIELSFTDKRFYTPIEHSAINVTYQLAIRNRNSDTLAVHLSNRTEYAIYRQDTVGRLADWKIQNKNNFRIAPD